MNGRETNKNVNSQYNGCRAAYDTKCLNVYFYVQLFFQHTKSPLGKEHVA